MNNPFFSIIIPVYNGLTHDLPICLDSIWNQPLDSSKYEVICVDDCSTDDTRRWLDEEAAKHSNLRVIKHSVNKRQGGGKNTGVKAAKGKYILFIDQDDYYHQGAVLEIFNKLQTSDLDILVTDYSIQYNGLKNNVPQGIYKNMDIMDGESFVRKNGNPNAPWRLVIKRDFYLHYQLSFQELTRIEDVDWGVKVFFYAKRVQYSPIIAVNYVKSGKNTTEILRKNKKVLKDWILGGVRTLDVANNLYINSQARYKIVGLAVAYFDYGIKYIFGINASVKQKLLLVDLVPSIEENSKLVKFVKRMPLLICIVSMFSPPFFRLLREYKHFKKSRKLKKSLSV